MKAHLILDIGNGDVPVKSVHCSMANAKSRLTEIEGKLRATALRSANPAKIIRASETALIILDETNRRVRTFMIDSREAHGHPLEMLAEEAE